MPLHELTYFISPQTAMNDRKQKTRTSPGSVSVWLGQIPAGDQEAHNRLLERYRPQVVGYARYRLQRLGVRHKDADDIAQEVFLGLFQRSEAGKLPDLNTRDALWLKLRRITGDRVKDARRKRLPFTESAVNVGENSSALPGMPQVADEQLDECLLMAENALIRRKLAERHPDLPEIVSLKVQGYSVDQIAEQMDVPKRTIERRLQWVDQICDEYSEE